MRYNLLKKFGQLEEIRLQTTEALREIDATRLLKPPGPGRWSAAQVLHHVVSSETVSLGYIRKKCQAPESVPSSGLGNALRAKLLVVALRLPLKFKAPEVVANVPENVDPAETMEKWAETRGQIRSLIENLPDELLSRAIYRHPIAGRMTMSQCLDFMKAHLARHGKQIERMIGGVK